MGFGFPRNDDVIAFDPIGQIGSGESAVENVFDGIISGREIYFEIGEDRFVISDPLFDLLFDLFEDLRERNGFQIERDFPVCGLGSDARWGK